MRSGALKHSPLQVFVFAWNGRDSNGVYVRTEQPINHAVCMTYKDTICDTYLDWTSVGTFEKMLAPDFNYFTYGIKYIVNNK